VIVATAADRRCVTLGGRLMLHRARLSAEDLTALSYNRFLPISERGRRMAAEIFAAATNRPIERVVAWMRQATTFNARAALEADLPHETA
jgi:hypothetical protein